MSQTLLVAVHEVGYTHSNIKNFLEFVNYYFVEMCQSGEFLPSTREFFIIFKVVNHSCYGDVITTMRCTRCGVNHLST